MAENRVLNLDEVVTVDVVLGGKPFRIRQDRRAVIERVLRVAHEEDKQPAEGEAEKPLSERLFENWETSLPAFALILGSEEGDTEHQAVVQHLREHLTVPSALAIYDEWWRLNEIESFFLRGGRPLLPPYIVRALQDGALTTPE